MGSSISWNKAADGRAQVQLSGRLTIEEVAGLVDDLASEAPRAPGLAVDLSGVSAIDTAGAWAVNSLVDRWQAAGHAAALAGAAPEIDRLIRAMATP
ncbi:STAS domain-containing protein, partial [Sandarakinorhabdus oryzae]|uniref:STAS domain-containing protein n=1 Tax=Sandarakinorhabdus oryzae TaxID=2675220 RepID=UPI0012E0F6D6